MLTLLVVLATQTGRTAITDTIAGVVSGPGGRPLAGAIVQATSAVTGLSRWQTSDAAGRFTIYFPGRAQYQLTAYYFGLVRGPVVPLWVRDDARAASIRLDLAGFANPIDTILKRYGVLGLTGNQITRLREVAASTNSFALPELERVRNILTASQWSRLSTELLPAAAMPRQARSAALVPADPAAPAAQRQVPVPKRPDLTLYTGLSTVYETNLIHAPAGLEAYGVLLGVGGDFRYRARHTTLEAQYDGVFRRYTGTDLWNVPGHDASVAISHRVARRRPLRLQRRRQLPLPLQRVHRDVGRRLPGGRLRPDLVELAVQHQALRVTAHHRRCGQGVAPGRRFRGDARVAAGDRAGLGRRRQLPLRVLPVERPGPHVPRRSGRGDAHALLVA